MIKSVVCTKLQSLIIWLCLLDVLHIAFVFSIAI